MKKRLIGAAVAAVLLIAGAVPASTNETPDLRYLPAKIRGEFYASTTCYYMGLSPRTLWAASDVDYATAKAKVKKKCTADGEGRLTPYRRYDVSVTCWRSHGSRRVLTRMGWAQDGDFTAAETSATESLQRQCTDSGGRLTRPPAPPSRRKSFSFVCWSSHDTSRTITERAVTLIQARSIVDYACRRSGGSLTRPAAPAPTPPPAERNEDLQELVEGILCWFTLPDLRSESRASVLDCIGAGGSTTKPLPPSPQHQIPEVPLTTSPDPDWPSVTVTCWLSRDSSTPVTQSGSTEANARGAAIRACRDDHDGTITKPPAPPTTYSSSVTCWVSRDPVCEGVIGSCKPASSTVTRTAATFDDASAAARKACVDSGGSLNRPATPPPVTCWISPADGSSRVDLGEVMQGPAGDSECNRRKARWREENENAPIMPPADAEKPPDKTQDENYREAFRRSRGGSSGGGVRGGGGGGGGMPPYFDDDILP